MSLNLASLAGQGRAYSAIRPWSQDELDALLALETERGLGRQKAADYIRNGVVSLEDYDKAVKADLVPKSLEDIHTDAVIAHAAETKAKLGGKKKK